MKNNSLQKRLAAYTALSVPFFAMSHHADAQILYTDVSPDDTLNMCDTTVLDLNNDGVMDFMLGVGKDIFTYWYGCLILKNESGSNGIAGIATSYSSTSGSSAAYFKLPNKLNYLEPIGASNNWVNPFGFNSNQWCNGNFLPYHHLAVFNFFLMGENKGNWNTGPTEGYVGLKINMNNETYYGWARLVVDSDAHWMILKDYAIDTIPDQNIGAGQCMCPPTVVASESDVNPVIVSPNPAADHFLISFANGSVITQLNIIDVEGRKRIVEWMKNESGLLVNTTRLNAGIYFAEVKTSDTVYRKKVLIQK